MRLSSKQSFKDIKEAISHYDFVGRFALSQNSTVSVSLGFSNCVGLTTRARVSMFHLFSRKKELSIKCS